MSESAGLCPTAAYEGSCPCATYTGTVKLYHWQRWGFCVLLMTFHIGVYRLHCPRGHAG